MKYNSVFFVIYYNLGLEKWNFKSEMLKCVVDILICSLIFFFLDCVVFGN